MTRKRSFGFTGLKTHYRRVASFPFSLYTSSHKRKTKGLDMNDTQRMIEQALSLRAPQKERLDLLAQITERLVLSKEESLEEALSSVARLSRILSVIFLVFVFRLPQVSGKPA